MGAKQGLQVMSSGGGVRSGGIEPPRGGGPPRGHRGQLPGPGMREALDAEFKAISVSTDKVWYSDLDQLSQMLNVGLRVLPFLLVMAFIMLDGGRYAPEDPVVKVIVTLGVMVGWLALVVCGGVIRQSTRVLNDISAGISRNRRLLEQTWDQYEENVERQGAKSSMNEASDAESDAISEDIGKKRYPSLSRYSMIIYAACAVLMVAWVWASIFGQIGRVGPVTKGLCFLGGLLGAGFFLVIGCMVKQGASLMMKMSADITRNNLMAKQMAERLQRMGNVLE